MVEEIEVTGCAGLENINDPLRGGRKMGNPHIERVAGAGGRNPLLREEIIEGEASHADTAVAQEPTARLEGGDFLAYFVIHFLKNLSSYLWFRRD